MLRAPDQDAPLQQGDIVRDVPFLVLPPIVNVKAAGLQGQKRIDSQNAATVAAVKEFSGASKLTATEVPLLLQMGVIVTQSCDLDFKDDVTLARVYPLGVQVQTARDAEEFGEPLVLYHVVQRLVEGAEFNHLVYLRLAEGHFVADLLKVQSFAKDWKECFRQQRIATMNDEGLGYLQARLTTFAGRFATTAGFWHASPQDAEMSARLRSHPGELENAFLRLDEKKKAAAKPKAKSDGR